MGALDAAQGIENGRKALITVQRILMLAAAGEAEFTCFDRDAGAGVFVAIEENDRGLAHQLAEEDLELGGPDDFLNAGAFARLGLGEFVALPDGDEFGGLTNKEDFPLFGIGSIREEYENGFFLIDATQVVKVAVLSKAKRAVGIGGHDVIGMQDDECTGRQGGGETATVFDEEFGGSRLVAHRERSMNFDRINRIAPDEQDFDGRISRPPDESVRLLSRSFGRGGMAVGFEPFLERIAKTLHG